MCVNTSTFFQEQIILFWLGDQEYKYIVMSPGLKAMPSVCASPRESCKTSDPSTNKRFFLWSGRD